MPSEVPVNLPFSEPDTTTPTRTTLNRMNRKKGGGGGGGGWTFWLQVLKKKWADGENVKDEKKNHRGGAIEEG